MDTNASLPPPSHPTPTPVSPPVAERRKQSFEAFGHTVHDEYAWLKANNWQDVLKNPEALPADIRVYLDAENAYTHSVLGSLDQLRTKLVDEMRGRIKEDDSSVPAPDGLYAYFTRYRTGGQHALIGRQPRNGGQEHILLDGDALSKGLAFFHFGSSAHSPDHTLQAWSADDRGSEFFTMRVRSWDSGKDLPDELLETDGHAVWYNDCKALLYVKLDDNHRPRQVFKHILGTPQSDDVLMYEEADEGWFVHIRRSATGRYAIIDAGDHETSENHFIDLDNHQSKSILIAKREPGLRYDADDRDDTLYILTNADGAVDFKIVTAPIASPSRQNWRDHIHHRPGVFILSHDIFSGHMARLERENAHPRIVIEDLSSQQSHIIAFDEEAYGLGLDGGYEFDTTTIRFTYSSMTTPSQVWSYDMDSHVRRMLKQQEIPSGHNAANYVTKRIFATSHDGAQVPISILYKKTTVIDGHAPLLLYGYGSYGYAMSASFSSSRFSLVDRGFVYAIAHIRGGTEKGWNWYLDGKRQKKTNTFDDFAASAQALIDAQYTGKKRIVGHGGSAGGMLMGAVANRAGELFAGVVAEVPFVDVLNTMRDASLPLTPPEWPEWGNPLTDETAFKTILSYSPYDNILPKEYPAILAMGGLTDPRVTYWEPAKWIARLRATMTGGGPVMLRTNMDAGHGGASGRFDRLEEVALVYAFALWATNTAQA
ncbi:MAG: S9 family peptidase [Beijerinckiaceae bacterium]